jgi:putative Mg2+ transporter-C (MgtC) family protein
MVHSAWHHRRVNDVGLHLDLAFRLLLSAVFGAAIGLEREINGHPAGMRTHLLVSLGSALFTVMSIYGFGPSTPATPVDPSRIAAQIVSGIGFLGAGAIIKDGLSIRGLTTAASLWATAAVGLAAGAAQHILAGVGALIIIFSLWPLSRLAERIRGLEKRLISLRLNLTDLGPLVDVFAAITSRQVEIVGVETERTASGRIIVDLDLRVRPTADLPGAIQAISALAGVGVERPPHDPT